MSRCVGCAREEIIKTKGEGDKVKRDEWTGQASCRLRCSHHADSDQVFPYKNIGGAYFMHSSRNPRGNHPIALNSLLCLMSWFTEEVDGFW